MPTDNLRSLSSPIPLSALAFLFSYGLFWMFFNARIEVCASYGEKVCFAYSLAGPALFSALLTIAVYALRSQRERMMTLSAYDSAIGQPDRWRLLDEMSHWLSHNLGEDGKTVVVLLRTSLQGQDLGGAFLEVMGENLQQWLIKSMRPDDRAIKLEAGYIMVIAIGITNRQAAKAVVEKIYAVANDFAKIQHADKSVIVKAGGFICGAGDSWRSVLSGVFGAFRQALDEPGSNLVIGPSKNASSRKYRQSKFISYG
jgi:hypothetical protein